MKNVWITRLQTALMLIFIFALFQSCSKEMIEEEVEQSIELQQSQERYIIVFNETSIEDPAVKFPESYSKSQIGMEGETKRILQKANLENIEIEKVYSSSIKGAALNLMQDQVEKLKKRKEVKYIERDRYELMAPPCGKGNHPPCENEEVTTQQVPYGITRVGGIADYTGDNVAWIIDSGIDIDHPDLNVDVNRGFRGPEVAPQNLEHPFDDDNGHGTHVAGTIGAINNDFGVIGVAPGVTVIPIKVLGENNSGWWSDVIAGIDYVAAHAKPGDVANMSLGGDALQAVDDAVLAASEKEIWFSLAAMNFQDDANLYSPARVNGEFVITVSAMDENDQWASFSNYGNPPIDYAAPGVLVLSSHPNGIYVSRSGTSMAAPHAAGVLLLGGAPSTDGSFINADPDGNPDPVIVYIPESCDQLIWYKDSDNDGYGVDNTETNILACDKPEDGYVLISGDCNDSDASIYPGAPDICNDCDPLNDVDCAVSSGINLSATGYKLKGVWHADLSWDYTGAVDIFRDGGIVASLNSSDGTYTDVTGIKGSGSLNYRICAAGSTANCSEEVTVQF